MKTEWDYTELADAYLKRPDYSDSAIDEMIRVANLKHGNFVCDIGAGVAHLTKMLVKRGLQVIAIEPNDAMRKNGIIQTKGMNVTWFEGTGENTNQKDNSFDLVTFGSSFNVCDRSKALIETKRILKNEGWFACMWNHRDLADPIQKSIEAIIKKYITSYDYGSRREDQTEIINQSNLFSKVIKIEGKVLHSQTKGECIEAWQSHATLHRQAGDNFGNIIKDIEAFFVVNNLSSIQIPYTTNLWMAQLK